MKHSPNQLMSMLRAVGRREARATLMARAALTSVLEDVLGEGSQFIERLHEVLSD